MTFLAIFGIFVSVWILISSVFVFRFMEEKTVKLKIFHTGQYYLENNGNIIVQYENGNNTNLVLLSDDVEFVEGTEPSIKITSLKLQKWNFFNFISGDKSIIELPTNGE